MRIGILASHPIQYQAPWFRALAKEVNLEAYFAHRQTAAEQGKAGFGVAFEWDVDLLSGYQHRFLRNVSRNPGVNHFAGCDTSEIADIILASSERGTRNAERFDAFIVCGWYLKSYLQAARACHASKVPVLVRGDSQLRTPRPLLKRLAMEVRQRWLLRKFDGFLSVGIRHREYLEHYGVPRAKIFNVPHFVDNDWFRGKAEIARKHRAEIRRQWGATDETLVALFVGKFIPKKRPADLLRALSILNSGSSTFNCLAVFVGSGELGPQLRESCHVVFDAEKSSLSASGGESAGERCGSSTSEPTSVLRPPTADFRPPASFLGFKNQTELSACYAAADVLVLPSDGGETWGLVVNEAMACGLPAIVSDDVGCAPDLINEGQTGFTYPLGDCVELARRIQSLTEMKQGSQDFAPALAEKMRAYNVEMAVKGTVEGIRKLKSQRR